MLDIVVMILAIVQAVELWWHGEWFAEKRKELLRRQELYVAADEPVQWWEALLCPFCMSNWVAIAVVGYMLITASPTWYCHLFRLPVYALAAARAANLVNDLTHSFSRTPRANDEPISEPSDPGDAPSADV